MEGICIFKNSVRAHSHGIRHDGRRKTAPIIVDGSRTANGRGRHGTARQPGKKFIYFNIDARACYRLVGSHVNAALLLSHREEHGPPEQCHDREHI